MKPTGSIDGPVKKNAGFTMIELSMVIIIFGMVSLILLLALEVYQRQQVTQATEEALNIAEAAALEFKIIHGRYPCPANPALGPGDANYGLENCAGALNVAGGRDTPADVDALPDRILIGSVPFNTMILGPDNVANTFDEISFVGLTDKLSTDGWGNKLTYAVSQSQTVAGTYNDFNGVINVVDENNLSVLATPSTAHFVLVSHGQNGRGARSITGTAFDPCPPALPVAVAPAISTPANEIWNCNNGGVFLQGLKNDVDHSYNDDTVRVVINQSGGLWQYTGLNRVSNSNSGFVGIGTPDPQQHLHVQGHLSANQLWANEYCDGAGAVCMAGSLLNPAFDADTGTAGLQNMRCPAGQVVTEIRNNQVVCAPAFTAAGALTCAPGLYLIGVSNVSGALCCDPLLPASNTASCAGFVP